jgi:hypothetical protein
MVNKNTYLINALKDKAYIDAQWVISILSVFRVDESKEQTKTKWQLISVNGFYHYFDEELNKIPLTSMVNNETKLIKDTEPLFDYLESITISNDDIVNLPKANGSIETTVGRLIQNYIMLVYPFGTKIDYINKRFKPKDVENIVLTKYTLDTPANENEKKNDLIYFDEYSKYMDACIHLTNFNSICVPTLTYKAMTPPPEAKAKLKELMEKYKGKLDNPVTLAEIQKELQAIDKKYMQGDRAEGFLISSKDYDVVRKKLFLMYGDVHGFHEDSKVDFLPKPLTEGVDFTKLDVYNNDARIGSYSRGKETVNGGTSVKELLRASANLSIDIDDCKTKVGLKIHLTEQNEKTYYGLYVIDSGKGVVKLTAENIKPYLNKTVMIRMPAYCKASGNSLCRICCGEYLSLHPNGLSAAVAETGNNILYLFMKAMHGKKLDTAKVNYKKLIR